MAMEVMNFMKDDAFRTRYESPNRYLVDSLALIMVLFLILLNHSNLFIRPSGIKDYHFTLIKVPYQSLWHEALNMDYIPEPFPLDENGVPMFSVNDSIFYHPAFAAMSSLDGLVEYRQSHIPESLQRAIITAETLRKHAIRMEDGLYFPYNFSFTLYDREEFSFEAPWVSGLAQGLMLSVYSRLYYETRHDVYRSVADSILATFSDYDSRFSPVFISSNDLLKKNNNYYWVDEYPHENRSYVLNGSLIGSIGLYDHWWVFGDKKSHTLFSQQLSTIKDNLLLFRSPGSPWFYDLGNRPVSAFYHKWSMNAVSFYSRITEDREFQGLYDIMYQDYHK